MSYSHRTMIVPANLIGTVRGMAAVLGSGGILDEFAVLLPCADWQQSDDGTWQQNSVYEGRAADVAAAVGVPVAAVQAVFDAVDISTQTADAAMARRGFVYTTGDQDDPASV